MSLPDPINEWKFDGFFVDGSKQKVKDVRGALDAVVDNFVAVPGRPNQAATNQALKFSHTGGAQRVIIGGTDLAPPWSMAAWVLREADTDGATLVSSADYALRLEQFFKAHNLGATEFNHNSDAPYSGGDFAIGPQGHVDLGRWYYVVVTGENGVTKFYLDGRPVGVINRTIKLPRGYIGSSHGVSEILEGRLDNLQFYNCIIDPVAPSPDPVPPPVPPVPPPPELPIGWNTYWVTINGTPMHAGSVKYVQELAAKGQITTWPFILFNMGTEVWNYTIDPRDQSGGRYKLIGPLTGALKPGEHQVLTLSLDRSGLPRPQWQCYVEGIPNDPHHTLQVEVIE